MIWFIPLNGFFSVITPAETHLYDLESSITPKLTDREWFLRMETGILQCNDSVWPCDLCVILRIREKSGSSCSYLTAVLFCLMMEFVIQIRRNFNLFNNFHYENFISLFHYKGNDFSEKSILEELKVEPLLLWTCVTGLWRTRQDKLSENRRPLAVRYTNVCVFTHIVSNCVGTFSFLIHVFMLLCKDRILSTI